MENLSFGYTEDCPLFERLQFSLGKGEFLGVKGPSGLGKTSLLYCLCGLIPTHIKGHYKGSILVNGQTLESLTLLEKVQTFAMILQDPNTQFFCECVEDELAFGLENIGIPRNEMKDAVRDMLERLELMALKDKNPSQLSGGQQRLVMLGSALIMNPKILIIDEIFSSLDEGAKEKVHGILKDYVKNQGTLIVVDHDATHFKQATHILTLKAGALWTLE